MLQKLLNVAEVVECCLIAVVIWFTGSVFYQNMAHVELGIYRP